MKVKRYIANDTQEAMLKVKSELGINAVILHSRKIRRSGILGFFKKPLVEIVAALEETDPVKKGQPDSRNSFKHNSYQNEPDKIIELQKQLGNVESLLNSFMNKVDGAKDNTAPSVCETYDKYLNKLMENGVEKNVAQKSLNIVKKQVSFTKENEEAVRNALKIIIRDYLGTPQLLTDKKKNKKIAVFIGPTGVGKTTTIAKLAAKMSITERKSVALITSDTYRIAAVEQLKTYSEIIGIPITIIYEPNEVFQAIEKYQDKDLILIDTAGRNHKKEEQLDEVKQLLASLPDPDIYLVISATTGYKDINNIISSYDFVNNYKLLFTKLDESSLMGNILNAKLLSGKALSYLTTGQSVPDDIEAANPDSLASMIVGEQDE
ncbi:MAG: flagellar biosynthesis protein FlhF [Bacillota bacterium]